MTDWEERYQSGDTPWDKGEAHPALRGWMQEDPLTGRVLVPGCGSGHDVRVLAEFGADVVGLDLAPSAIAAALRFSKSGNESYRQGDLFDLPSDWDASFDAVFEHTCFCAIPPEKRPDYVTAVAKVLKPGGRLLGVFFLNPDTDGEGPPFGCSAAELESCFGSRFSLAAASEGFSTYPGREGRERRELRIDRREIECPA